ncbi:hypothetical protein ACNF49_13935 [Actinomadura sp. ATCC 39365]
MSARQRQLAAARVLVALLNEDLPEVTWRISEHGAPALDGQMALMQTPADIKLNGLQRWADLLGAEIVSTPYGKRTGGSASVIGHIEGVRVCVWAAFLKKDLPKKGGDLQ